MQWRNFGIGIAMYRLKCVALAAGPQRMPLTRRFHSRLHSGFFVVLLTLSASCVRANNHDITDHPTASCSKLQGQFEHVFEPSGITQLANGKFVLVEDEQKRAFSLLQFNQGNTEKFYTKESRLHAHGNPQQIFAAHFLDDLEGIARESEQYIFAIGSHNNNSVKRAANRKKLIRARVSNNEFSDLSIAHDLREQLLSFYPILQTAISKNKQSRKAGIDFEAIAFDRRRNRLLIGLRSPLVNGRAALFQILNPVAYIDTGEKPEFPIEPTLLDLDGGGFRAMAYDDLSDQLLIVSRREAEKKKFKLWKVQPKNINHAKRIHIKKSLYKVEGIAAIQPSEQMCSGVLFVRDNGNEHKAHGAQWFILSRKQLGLDD